MEKEKRKTKGKAAKVLTIVAIVLVVLTISQFVVLGALGGIGPMKFIRNIMMSKLPGNAAQYHPENVTALETSPLKGKRLLFLGSSVTNGTAALETSMADYLQVLDGCDVVKEVANGTTLADKSNSSYLSRLKKLDTAQHFDAVIVQLSTNDADQNVTLGAVSNSKDISSFDTKTMVGSMEAIILYVQETWDCPVVFYTGVQFHKDKDRSEQYAAAVAVMSQLEEKWGIHVIDLWNDEKINAVSQEDYDFYMDDEIHPTQAGYLLWWTPVFQSYLYELLG